MSTDVPLGGLHGSINHVSITVSDLPNAMKFFRPLLEFMGYSVGDIVRSRSGNDFTLNINLSNGTGINVWQAKAELSKQHHEMYAPSLHHLAFNVEKHEQVDAVHSLVSTLGATILDPPGEFPFGPGGYYATYFLGPDRIKMEIVHMPLAERRFGEMASAIKRGMGL